MKQTNKHDEWNIKQETSLVACGLTVAKKAETNNDNPLPSGMPTRCIYLGFPCTGNPINFFKFPKFGISNENMGIPQFSQETQVDAPRWSSLMQHSSQRINLSILAPGLLDREFTFFVVCTEFGFQNTKRTHWHLKSIIKNTFDYFTYNTLGDRLYRILSFKMEPSKIKVESRRELIHVNHVCSSCLPGGSEIYNINILESNIN